MFKKLRRKSSLSNEINTENNFKPKKDKDTVNSEDYEFSSWRSYTEDKHLQNSINIGKITLQQSLIQSPKNKKEAASTVLEP